MVRSLSYEKKKLNSFPQLIRELDVIDLDAGVRAIGKFKGKKCFVFVTKVCEWLHVHPLQHEARREGQHP